MAVSGAVSGEELGHASDELRAARDALTAAEKNLAASTALVGHTGVADNPDVQAAATQVERAWLSLVRTSVRAPLSGYVARRSVQLGDRIAPGTPLMAVVPLERLWVEANFKEVQLGRMRIGQPVKVVSDLYGEPRRVSRPRPRPRHGHRRRVRAAAGAERHRQLDQGGAAGAGEDGARSRDEVRAHPLRIGLSTDVSVDVHDTSGLQLAATPARRAGAVDACLRHRSRALSRPASRRSSPRTCAPAAAKTQRTEPAAQSSFA